MSILQNTICKQETAVDKRFGDGKKKLLRPTGARRVVFLSVKKVDVGYVNVLTPFLKRH